MEKNVIMLLLFAGIMQQINYEYVYNTLPMLLAYTRLQEQQKQQQIEQKRERSERNTLVTLLFIDDFILILFLHHCDHQT